MLEVSTIQIGEYELRTVTLHDELHYLLCDITKVIGYRVQPKTFEVVHLPDTTGRQTRLLAVSENELIARLANNKRGGSWLLEKLLLPEFPELEPKQFLLWTDAHGEIRLGHIPNYKDCRCPQCIEAKQLSKQQCLYNR